MIITNRLTGFYLRVFLLFSLLLAFTQQGIAATLTFDLSNGTFVTLPATGSQPNDYTGVYQSPTLNAGSVSIAAGQTGIFDLLFNNGVNDQFIKLSDAFPPSLPNEGVIFTIAGMGNALVNPVIRLLGATGSYRTDSTTNSNVSNATVDDYLGASESFSNGIRTGFFNNNFPNDPARSIGSQLDVTNSMLAFQGVQLELFNQGSDTITVDSLSFVAVGNEVQVSTVPVPAALWLFATGLIGLFRIAKSEKQ